LWRLSHGAVEEPELIGTPAALGGLPQRTRRVTVTVLFAVATVVILLCAEPFANSLIQAGTELGVDQFLLVQWLAPLSSEAPELIIAVLFAIRGKGTAAIAVLISSKVNQWTLLVGSLPLAYLAGGGSTALVLDGRQIEEMLLTAAQTMMGVAVLLALRFPRWAAWALLALFLVQFALTDTTGRLVLAGVYLVLATAALVWHRQTIIPTLLAPFRPSTSSQSTSQQAPGPGRVTGRSGLASDIGVPMTSTLRSQPGTSGQVVAPRGSQDLRGHLLTELRYPRNSIVVLAGIPGAGKARCCIACSVPQAPKPSQCATTTGFSCWTPNKPATTSGAACSRCPTRCGGPWLISFNTHVSAPRSAPGRRWSSMTAGPVSGFPGSFAAPRCAVASSCT
jgi:hypothetical protein